jgi:hypothetical protein
MSQAVTSPTSPPPAPQRVRLEGTLDMVRASDASFTLRLADGRELPGRLVARKITTLATLLGRQVLVFGTGQFGPTGELERVDADGFLHNDGELWGSPSDDRPISPEERAELARRFQSVIGQWPGDETDEQIEQALREMS